VESSEDLNPSIIFFLTSNGNIPKWYIGLSESLNRKNIQCVPIKLDQLNSLVGKSEQMHVICFESSLKGKKLYGGRVKNFFDLAIKMNKLVLYHVSSFREFDILSRYKRSQSYNYFHLPITIDMVVSKISSIYFDKSSQIEEWPGGRRGGMINFTDPG
jgi:hypothetical protein